MKALSFSIYRTAAALWNKSFFPRGQNDLILSLIFLYICESNWKQIHKEVASWMLTVQNIYPNPSSAYSSYSAAFHCMYSSDEQRHSTNSKVSHVWSQYLTGVNGATWGQWTAFSRRLKNVWIPLQPSTTASRHAKLFNIFKSQRVCLPLGYRELICWMGAVWRGTTQLGRTLFPSTAAAPADDPQCTSRKGLSKLYIPKPTSSVG